MPISFSCPHCQKVLRANNAKAGGRVKCPGCGQPISIPRTTVVQAIPQQRASESAPKRFSLLPVAALSAAALLFGLVCGGAGGFLVGRNVDTGKREPVAVASAPTLNIDVKPEQPKETPSLPEPRENPRQEQAKENTRPEQPKENPKPDVKKIGDKQPNENLTKEKADPKADKPEPQRATGFQLYVYYRDKGDAEGDRKYGGDKVVLLTTGPSTVEKRRAGGYFVTEDYGGGGFREGIHGCSVVCKTPDEVEQLKKGIRVRVVDVKHPRDGDFVGTVVICEAVP
jgi:hypothetical protein